MPPTLFRIFSSSEPGLRLARAIAGRLRATLHDADRIPRKGPALLVGNHALLGLDSLALTATIVSAGHRAPRFLGERNLWRVPGLRAALDAVGAVPGRPDEAVTLLEQGELVMVYPGGVDDS